MDLWRMKLFQAPDMIAPYPVPDWDSGKGMHDTVDCYLLPDQWGLFGTTRPDYRAFCDELIRRQIYWYKLFSDNRAKLDLASALLANGIMVVFRLWQQRPHPNWRVVEDDIRPWAERGVVYYEFGNEPNLLCEAEGARFSDNWVQQINDQWVANCETLWSLGGKLGKHLISLYPALSPGGNYQHIDFYLEVFADLKARYNDWFVEHARRGDIAFAVHPRPGQHPLDYPADPVCVADKGRVLALTEDSTGHCLYELVLDLCKETFGFTLPLIATEAGFSANQDDGDRRYQIVSLDQHTYGNMEIFHGFRDGRWRPELLAECMWFMWGPEGEWRNDPILGNQAVMGGGDMPLWDHMLQDGRYERNATNVYGEQPDEPEPEEPPEEDEPTMEEVTITLTDPIIVKNAELFRAWVAAGGVANNFTTFKLGQDIINGEDVETTASQLQTAIGEVKSKADELALVASRYPF